jgi:uncharacterized OsmC-like protein
MDSNALRALQAPLKDKYRSAPDAATITLKAQGTLDDQHIACKVETGRALAIAGLHPATGGSGAELCSGDMLLEALVACAGLRSHKTCVDKGAPVGFKAIRLSFEVDTDAPQEKVDQLLKLTERYCVVFQTLNNKPDLAVDLRNAS